MITAQRGGGAAHGLNNVDSNAPQKLPYPKRVFLILGNEFCERFMFYGLDSKYFVNHQIFDQIPCLFRFSRVTNEFFFRFILFSYFGVLLAKTIVLHR